MASGNNKRNNKRLVEELMTQVHPDLKGLIWYGDGSQKNWTGKDKKIRQKGIKGSLIVSGKDDPSLIWTTLPVVPNPDPWRVASLNYYPTYQGLSPEQRGLYWNFLHDPYNTQVDTGYVFLLYYGLERHLISGETDRALDVILKLRDVHANASFQNYSANAVLLTAMYFLRDDMIRKFFESLDKAHEMQFSSNLYLLGKMKIDRPLTALDIMTMARAFGFTKRTYLHDYPELFLRILTDTMEEVYEKTEVLISEFVSPQEFASLEMQRVPLFANMALQSMTATVNGLITSQNLCGCMCDLLSAAYDICKKVLAEMRRDQKAAERQKKKEQAIKDTKSEEGIKKENAEKTNVQSPLGEMKTEGMPAARGAEEVTDTVQNKRNEAFEQGKLGMLCELLPIISFSLQQNGFHLLQSLKLYNGTDEDFKALRLRIVGENGLLDMFECGIDDLPAGGEVVISDLNIPINAEYLASLTESLTSSVTIMILQNEEILLEETKSLRVLTYESWSGLAVFPEMLASFVMPNHPVITELLHSASGFLKKWGEKPSLEGYQAGDPNRARMLAAAAYAAIQEKNIIYAMPPASFEVGQKVRLPDAVMDQKMGTCMDMTLLYAAVLEAMGLNPVLILIQGHIFAGVWLVDSSFPDGITDDPVQLEKRMAQGIHEMTAVECTSMNAGKSKSFEESEKIARHTLSNYAVFQFALDVARSRALGIRPMPARILDQGGYQIVHEERAEDEITEAPEAMDDIIEAVSAWEPQQVTKISRWERKLLDLSLRNMLINMRLTKSIVPLLSGEIGNLEDALADGEEFQVFGRPENMEYAPGTIITMEITNEAGPFADLIRMECKHHRLHTILTESETNHTLTKLYRSARTSLEENGASTLFLTLGLLRWFESKNSDQPRYAPLVLIPVDITRKSASKGFALKMRDEEPQLNITLLEMLKQEFDLVIPGLDPIPQDDHGVDMKLITALVRKAVMEEPRWDVIESGFLGNFSFSQFVMWKDIHDQAEFLSSSSIVRSLVDGHLDPAVAIAEKKDTNQTVYLPLTADASQIEAIRMAASGNSFVLQGPPGTGKSQTITAMIANAAANGERVLFVAEKMAALSVVEKRLSSLGLSDFCLELHSNKANKTDVLNHLKKVLEISRKQLPTEYAKRSEQLRLLRQKLDDYAGQLHKVQPCGWSLYQLIEQYEDLADTDTMIPSSFNEVKGLSRDGLEQRIRILAQMINAGRLAGNPVGHPLSGVIHTVYSQRLRAELPDICESYKGALREVETTGNRLAEIVGEPLAHKSIEWNRLNAIAQILKDSTDMPEILKANHAEEVLRELSVYLSESEAIAQRKEELLKKWNESFLRLDMNMYEASYRAASQKRIGRGRAMQAVVSELSAYATVPISEEQIPVLLSDVKLFQMDERKLGDSYQKLSSDAKKLEQDVKDQASLLCLQTKLSDYRNRQKRISDLDFSKIKMTEASVAAMAYIEASKKLGSEDARMTGIMKIAPKGADEDMIPAYINLLESITENADRLREWILLNQASEACREAGLEAAVEAYQAGINEEELIPAYKKGLFYSLIMGIVEESSALNRFTGVTFNEMIDQFRRQDERLMELTKKEIYYQLASRLPYETESSEIGRELHLLRRAIANNGRGLSIRGLFDQIPHILMRLCPCMLMSPISVAQYMEVKGGIFDVIIFDEASQIPTCKAVGVLARGKNAVIVGDPNQMPPTSFFAGNTIDEDNLDMEDLESILDDTIAIGVPQKHLDWHYRSRHESLIAFSNREFYGNRMLTFPSVNDRARRVSMTKVEGVFERGKTRQNKEEAKAVVEEIKKRFFDPVTRDQSIGVVTFNIPQQTLIEDMMQEEYRKNSALDAWANEREDTLFIKNLENVQGDERDVILFSIGYGPDEEGKTTMNFGPLNREGGWKRLNVAVSRARLAMVVFSSLEPEQVDLTRTKARGVAALKAFLEFAKYGKIGGDTEALSEDSKYNNGIIRKLCARLKAEGYQYQLAIGHSDFRVDIAVVDPADPKQYVLGILLDGESYQSMGNARDREIGQNGVLKGLGWNLCRIWSMDWWDDSDREVSRVLSILKELCKDRIPVSGIQPQEESAVELPTQELPKTEVALSTANADTRDLPADEVEEEAVEAVEEQEEMEVSEVEAEREGKNEGTGLEEVSNNIVQEFSFTTADKDISDTDRMIASEKEAESAVLFSGLAGENTESEVEKYVIVPYQVADLEETPMSTKEYESSEARSILEDKVRTLINCEGPISRDLLVKKLVRSCGIGRVTQITDDATEKIIKRLKWKANRLNGLKTYWPEGILPEDYRVFRISEESSQKRNLEDIAFQEKKNAVCFALQENANLTKDELIRETSKIMGYARLSQTLREQIDDVIKYAKKIGAIQQCEDKTFELSGR